MRFEAAQRHRPIPDDGFTVIELMITVAIIAILAAIAFPSYTDYVTRGKFAEAKSQLADLRVKMEQWFQDNRTYLNAGATACGVAMPVAPTVQYFTFSCPTFTATTYTISANGVVGSPTDGIQFTIDQNNAKTTVVNAPASTTGWTGNASCWISKKGGLC
jgi:type IV pilus assembly protein PilE